MPEPEELARQKIDKTLEAAGWVIQDMKDFNRKAALGVAVREFQTNSGPCDYLLFVDGKAAGVIEAKKSGVTLSGVAEQFRCFNYDELIKRDKLNLDIFWLKDDSLEDIENLPVPEVIAAEIVENLQAALEQFQSVAEELE